MTTYSCAVCGVDLTDIIRVANEEGRCPPTFVVPNVGIMCSGSCLGTIPPVKHRPETEYAIKFIWGLR